MAQTAVQKRPNFDNRNSVRLSEKSRDTTSDAPDLKLSHAYLGIFLVACSVLLLELSLTRIFSAVLWTHLAFFVIGTALFGFGLSGLYAAFRPIDDPRTLSSHLARYSVFMAITVLVMYSVICFVPFHIWSIVDNPSHLLSFAVWVVAILAPFFFAGLIVTHLLSCFPRSSGRLYGADLIGASAGAVLILFCIKFLGAEGCVALATLILLVTAGIFRSPRSGKAWTFLLVSILLAATLVPKLGDWLRLPNPEKKQLLAHAEKHGRVYSTKWSPVSLVKVVGYPKKRRIHGKKAMGLLIDNGTNVSVIMQWSGNTQTLKPMDVATIGAPYNLLSGSNPNVLIIGPSGGREVLISLSYGAEHIDAVEMDPSIVSIVNEKRFADFMGHLYQQPKVSLHEDEGRSFLRRQPLESYDVIQFVNNYTPVAISAGALNLTENYLLTEEAILDYYDHLKPGGVLAMHRGNTLRLALAVTTALRRRGVAEPHRQVLVTNGEFAYFQGILVKKGVWEKDEVTQIKSYVERFLPKERPSMLWDPTSEDSEAIYGKVLRTPVSQIDDLSENLGVNLFPPTDDRPFSEHYLQYGKHRISPELPVEYQDENNRKWNGIPRSDAPYIVVLAECALLALLFLGVPAVLFARRGAAFGKTLRLLPYFGALGIGFILVEICLMQQFVLFLGAPAYSMTFILITLLLSSGLGSFYSQRFWERFQRKAIPLGVLSACAMLVLVVVLAPSVFHLFLGSQFGTRVIVSGLLIFPVGFCLGLPFPLGLQLLGEQIPDAIDARRAVGCCWAMNGYTTVIGSGFAVFVPLLYGFKVTLVVAALVYLFALSVGVFALRGSRT